MTFLEILQNAKFRSINEMLVRRISKVLLPHEYVIVNELVSDPRDLPKIKEIGAMIKNFENLGFGLSRRLITTLDQFSPDELGIFYNHLLPSLKKMKGANVQHVPMYPNFPKQVMEMEEAQLYINAMFHYFGDVIGARIIPKFDEEIRSPLLETNELIIISDCEEEEVHEIFHNLMKSKTSISEQDKVDIKIYLSFYHDHSKIPDEIPNKEILAYLAALSRKLEISKDLAHLFSHATDILRFAVAISNGDISLAEHTKFVNFKRVDRRFILNLLEKDGSLLENLFRHRMKWIRLAEKLHPGEYSKRYPRTHQAFHDLRNNIKPQTFDRQVQRLFEKEEFDDLVELLRKRPGVFSRKLDHLIRSFPRNIEQILTSFEEIIGDVATPMVFQIMNHFRSRKLKLPFRIFMPKGGTARTWVLDNQLPEIVEEVCQIVVNICQKGLINRFSKLEPLGKVRVDTKLVDFNLPYSERSASAGLRRITRGSRTDLPEGSTIRMFIYWIDGTRLNKERRIDLDLSAIMLNSDFNYISHVSYTNLKEDSVYHSGDLTSAPAPEGASEFIDININDLLELGGRYVVMNVFSYTRTLFSQVPNAFAGWMMREETQSGEIFEPSTVEDKFSMSSETLLNLPYVFDLEEKKAIWLDLGARSVQWHEGGINLESNLGPILAIIQAAVMDRRSTLYDLFALHAKARGTLLENDEEVADIEFLVENGIQFEFEKIVGEFLQ